MAQPYTVLLPGGGSITVNANSPQAAQQNAQQQTPSLNWGSSPNPTVVAGGHQTTTSNGTTSINPNAHVGAGEVGRAPNAGGTNPFLFGNDGFSPTNHSVTQPQPTTTPFQDYLVRQAPNAAPDNQDWLTAWQGRQALDNQQQALGYDIMHQAPNAPYDMNWSVQGKRGGMQY